MMTSHDASYHDDHAGWWASLSTEQRYTAIEMVRLDQDPEFATTIERPTGERAEFVRGTPEYLERFAGADKIAHTDETGIGPDIVPGSHDDTKPIL